MTKQEQDMLSEIHQYLLSKDGMRLGQRIKSNFRATDSRIQFTIDRIGEIQDSIRTIKNNTGMGIVVGGVSLWFIIAVVCGTIGFWINSLIG